MPDNALNRDPLEAAITEIEGLLTRDFGLSKRTIAIQLMQGDDEIRQIVAKEQPEESGRINKIIEELKPNYSHPIEYELSLRRREDVGRILARTVKTTDKKPDFREKLSRQLMNPVVGLPVLFLVLYFGFYKFVGSFGAGTVVNFIEHEIFENNINPYMVKIAARLLPWQVVRDLFVGEYGMLTLGVRYAVALILPIVTFFFIMFSVIEDSGYLPRLAMLIDRSFKKIGLSGRAVIPMTLAPQER